jgi:hypothetical protein
VGVLAAAMPASAPCSSLCCAWCRHGMPRALSCPLLLPLLHCASCNKASLHGQGRQEKGGTAAKRDGVFFQSTKAGEGDVCGGSNYEEVQEDI